MKSKCAALAKEHAALTSEDCSQIMFSNDWTLQQFGIRKKNVRRPVGNRFKKRFAVSTIK